MNKKKDAISYLQTLFHGLDRRDVGYLYEKAHMRRLQAGDVCYCNEKNSYTFCFILSGKLKRYDDNCWCPDEGLGMGKGDCVKESGYSNALVATEPATIMLIDNFLFETLGAEVKLFFYKKTSETAETRNSVLVEKNLFLKKKLFDARSSNHSDYGTSDFILSVVKKIPRMPVAAINLAVKLFEDKITSAEAASLVKRDPALAGSVLKTINSSYYGFSQKISDIHHAVLFLGFNTVNQIVMAESLRRTLPITPEFQRLYFQSVAVSHMAFLISNISKIGKPSEIGTIALLHNLGRNVSVLLKKQNPKLSVMIDKMDNSLLGSLLLKEWNLPKDVWQTVEYHMFPEFAPPEKIPVGIRNNVAVIYFSRLCYSLFDGSPSQDLPLAFFGAYKKILGWDSYTVDHIAEKIVLREIVKNLKSYPRSFRQFIENYIQKRIYKRQ